MTDLASCVGDAFFSTKGERFDAHTFLSRKWLQNGCQVAIVERPIDAEIAQLVVADTRLALGQLGAYRREQNAHQLKVIAFNEAVVVKPPPKKC